MSNKQLFLNERINTQDKGIIKGTRVTMCIPGTDKPLWVLENKVLAAGSAFIASKHFDFGANPVPAPVTPSYNQALFLDSPGDSPTTGEEKIYLFCMGTDGCGETSAQQYEVDYAKWLKPEDMLPFRYVPDTADLNDDDRKKYFGRATELDETGNKTGYIKYYFKGFETNPLWIQERIDGSAITSELYDDTTSVVPIQSFVRLKLMISPQDAREWFKSQDIRNGYVNTISLLEGYVVESGGNKYYMNIHPVTKLNFPTEYLIDPTKGLDITYDIFY